MAERLKKILIVDDEKELVDSLEMALEAEGFEVLTALEGSQALHLARTWLPDLIVLDLMMPCMDGYAVCRLLKFDVRFQNIPILILSARAEQEDERLAQECRADGYLTKPFRPQVLLEKIRTYLKNKEAVSPDPHSATA